MYKQQIYKHGHPLSAPDGRIRKSRYVLYEKLNGISGNCHWCDIELNWKTVCADHLDSNIMNDVPENLVASCRGCNANRVDGTGHGRRKSIGCKECSKSFLPRNKDNIYCSVICASKNRPKREIKSLHGTRSRYVRGCRCGLCHNANLKYSREHYKRNK
jgi:hypothetical protein